MATSADHQKQKLTPLKSRRLAQNIIGQFIPLPGSPLKRFSLIGAGLLVSIGTPVLVLASQHPKSPSRNMESAAASTVTIQSTASSHAEGAVSLYGKAPETQTDQSSQTSPVNTTVVINGETVPTTGNSVSERILNDDGSRVDIDITIDDSTPSSSSSNSVNISIDSPSSSSTVDQTDTRGSPRR